MVLDLEKYSSHHIVVDFQTTALGTASRQNDRYDKINPLVGFHALDCHSLLKRLAEYFLGDLRSEPLPAREGDQTIQEHIVDIRNLRYGDGTPEQPLCPS
jgi:hypothetical protein